MIQGRFTQIIENITNICNRIDRNPAEIVLVGVTKYAAVEPVRDAIAAGLKHIGENKVQDAERKFSELGEAANQVTKHMIGHLQTNKVKTALQVFDMIQSVDSVKLIREIEKQAAKIGKTVDILIEVNCSGEEQKYGAAPKDLTSLVEEVDHCEQVKLLGLMTMAPYTDDVDVIRRCFRDLKSLSLAVHEKFIGHPRIEMKYLSMGMSNDYEIALEEGANMVRIGTAIFGEE